jgi:hypothetical protein
MNRLPDKPWSSAKGYALLKRTLEGNRPASEPPEEVKEVNIDSVDSKDLPEEDPPFWTKLLDALATMDSGEWARILATQDSREIALLADTLDDYSEHYKNHAGETRVDSVHAHAGVMLLLRRAVEQGKGQAAPGQDKAWVSISDYLHIMWLRERASVREIPRSEVSYRALARRFGVSDKTVKAWDKRAEGLGVTLDDWDADRLARIVKPSMRAPP